MDLISMTCRSCGGKLQISKDADQFICQHCGTEYLVSFAEGAISIKLLSEGIQKIQASSDKTASELALVRIKNEKDEIIANMKLLEEALPEFIQDHNLKFFYEEGPSAALDVLNQALKFEKSQKFKDKEIIKAIEEVITDYDEDATMWKKLLEQEAYHRNIVENT